MTFDECQEQSLMIMDDAPRCFQTVEECDELCPLRGQLKAADGRCYTPCVYMEECFENVFVEVARGKAVRDPPVNGCAAGHACQLHHYSAFAPVGICVPQKPLEAFDECMRAGCKSEGAFFVNRPHDCPTGTECLATTQDGVWACTPTEPSCGPKCEEDSCCTCERGLPAWMACMPPMPCADGSYPEAIEGECCAFEECPRKPEFNCLTKERWSDAKSEWCCENEQLGCPTEPAYNCLTKEMWSDAKSEWCCENEQLGCPTEPAYNCLTKEMWSDAKSDWCCEHEKLGCPGIPECQDSNHYSQKPSQVKKALNKLKKQRNKFSKKYKNLKEQAAAAEAAGEQLAKKQAKKLKSYKKKFNKAQAAYAETKQFVELCL